MRPSLPFLL
ncbi:hypothetical protein E2C01_072904 [Portunus trituberculatus]|uniref:Uncharacterized protein n=1 Tax=Portunus trituberculatus TaxID=210409 RepID=A0A5B7IBY0_PORTR|nr:hypothetical protein [Portunus trituberculatus]